MTGPLNTDTSPQPQSIVARDSMASNDELADIKCMLCLSDVLSLPDVRKLPCGHIGCLKCLKEDQQIRKKTTCPVCKNDRGTCDFEDLELVFQKQEKKKRTFQCGARDCRSEATCYCTLCKSLFCTQHEKIHKQLMPKSHDDTMPLLIYKNKLEKFTPVCCAIHKELVTVACSICFILLCDKCDQSQNCSKDTSGRKLLILKSVGCLAVTIKEKFRERFTNLTEVEDSLDSQLREILQESDEIRKKNEQLNEDIVMEVAKMQDRLKREEIPLKETIADTDQDLLSSVQAMIDETSDFHRKCAGALKRTTKFLEGNEAMVIKSHEGHLGSLKELIETEQVLKFGPPIVKKLKLKDMPITLEDTRMPQDLKLNATLPMNHLYNDICHLENGSVISCYNSNISGLEFSPNIQGTVRSIAVFRDGLFVLAKQDYHIRLYRIALGNPERIKNLMQVQAQVSRGVFMSVGGASLGGASTVVREDSILITDLSISGIYIYSFNAALPEMPCNHKCSIKLDAINSSGSTQNRARFLSGSRIVISDYEKKLVYSVDFTSRVQWRCEMNFCPIALAVDPNEQFIMVAELNESTIHLLTKKGVLVKSYPLPHCSGSILAISLFRNESLAVSCQDNKIRKYKFVYKTTNDNITGGATSNAITAGAVIQG